MKVVVQKFGGTSLQTKERRERSSEHVIQALQEGYKVVVVVSAMGRSGDPYATDTLLSLAEGPLSKREEDQLLACGETISSVVFSSLLQHKGVASLAMTGAQAGFRTTEDFGDARIIEVRSEPLEQALQTVDVVVVTGFQGETVKGVTATLGRGGSDTSATAIGAALEAEYVDIFTDVPGIMTADPRVVNNAHTLSVVSYNEVCNMAYQGAKVIHPRAVEVAMQAKVPVRIRSTMDDDLGTLITSSTSDKRGGDVSDRPITGIAHVKDLAQVTVSTTSINDQAIIFEELAKNGISVDFISIQTEEVMFTVPLSILEKVKVTIEKLGLHAKALYPVAKVSAVGAGMSGVPGITAKIVTALSAKGIDILQAADSHTTIWVLVHEKDMNTSVNALHDKFLSVTK
ncbi:aspartate kinase [Paenalkalicoccus suaedae]|uniref:Aspartokinase n=1 Tax=Paenalkalicoccus suaedae TaxID=2592382 RepID=A0A859FFA8_9BACI|nr:aspartate kinase [Paenalkalicoccus suaedae]QKS71382.1 aspartate kinase [Paenalkalicoccus suaedae]